MQRAWCEQRLRMAWGRKKSGGGRKEPQFGLAAALSELRLSPQDRVTVSEDKPKKSSAKRKSENEAAMSLRASANPAQAVAAPSAGRHRGADC